MVLNPRTQQPFPKAAARSLEDSQLRKNVRHATAVISEKRSRVVEKMPEWQDLRDAGSAVRRHTMARLDTYLEQFKANCTRAGGNVHWASDAAEACDLALKLTQAALRREQAPPEVLKIKSMTSEEIGLNLALEAAGLRPYETDLAELIIQLGHDEPSHLVVPALHKNRQQISAIFRREMNLPTLGEDPMELAEAARNFLNARFLSVPVAVSGANFLLTDTGGVCIVESEGNGRMCLTLPKTLITIAGIDKVLPAYRDLEVMLQTLPRSATSERMNPYTSIWTGTQPGDGPQEFHVILLDNGRSAMLADEVSRLTLHCIRCGACQNACPVYQQTGGHAYGSVFAGPIGAILTPQLLEMKAAQTLPYASSLCGACYEVCPVKINIPEVLVHLRYKVAEARSAFYPERLAMKLAATIFLSERRLRAAQRLARISERTLTSVDGSGDRWITWLPGLLGGWTQTRDLKAMPPQTFREWWNQRGKGEIHEHT